MALYLRSTKTRSTSLQAQHVSVKVGESAEQEKMITIKIYCQDGKERSISLYGDEVDYLIYRIKNPATE